MLRKTILAIAATASLGAVALTPNSASAFGGHWGGHWGYGWHGVYVGSVYDACMQRRWVRTPVGPRLRWVNLCY